MADPIITVLVLAFLAAFIVDLVGNVVEFDHKFSNAIASTLIFLVVVGAATWYLNGSYEFALLAAGLLFIADLICNYVVPRNRLLNALSTGVLFAAFLSAALYWVLS